MVRNHATLLLCALAVTACAPDGRDGVDRGRYLVRTMGCAECHSPRGPDGVALPGRDLTGHPADAPLPVWDPSLLGRHNLATVAPTGTAFAGPFGVSVAPNLTPDAETGIGGLTADALVDSWRSGRHWREPRAVLPPMPMASYRLLDESDVRAIHAYLHSLRPVRNPTPPSRPSAGTR